MQIKKIRAKEKCTVYLILVFLALSISVFFSRPRKSMLKEVVSDVKAPSALGKAAEISPIRKTMPAAGLRYLNAIVGKRSSVIATLMLSALAKKTRNAPRTRNMKTTTRLMVLKVNIFF